MIASRVGLAVLAAIAALLALVLVLEPRRGPADHALVPGLRVDDVRELTASGVKLARDDRGWAWVEPAARADGATLDALLSALRGARWHRRADRATAGVTPAARSLVVDGDTLTIGQPLAGTDQVWLARSRQDDAVLVDAWVAHALAPEPVLLRVHHPLADPPPGKRPFRLDPAYAQARADAYAAIEPVAVPPCPTSSISVGAPSGEVCADPAKWEAVRKLDTEGLPFDHRPLRAIPAKLVLADRGVLELAHGARIDGHTADPERVRDLLAVLLSAGTGAALPAEPPASSIAVTSPPHDDTVLDLYPRLRVVVRRGEPVAIELPADAFAVLVRPSASLRDEARWLEEPSTISAIELDGKRLARGPTVGEWPGARDPALVEALASSLAALRAPVGPAFDKPAHTIVLTITPPAGAPSTHRLELGAHCAARADGEPVTLALQTCTAVTAALAAM